MSRKISVLMVLSLVFLLIKLSLSRISDVPEVIFCDVGQGDATLVQKGTFQLLIDAGPDEKVVACLQNNMPFGDQTLDWAIVSHPHADHYQGLTSVWQSYRVANLMIDNIPQMDEQYLGFYEMLLNEVETGQTKIHHSMVNRRWRFFDNLVFEVIYSPEKCSPEEIFVKKLSKEQLSAISTKCEQKINNINNASIGVILNIDNILFTFTGDLEAEEELALVASGLLTKTDVLKIPHHGSKSSSTADFLGVLKPKIGLISVAAKNSYGHPNAEVLTRYQEHNTTLYRTDEDGEIHFRVIDGNLKFAGQ